MHSYELIFHSHIEEDHINIFCFLKHAYQCCKNHTKNCIDLHFWFGFEHTENKRKNLHLQRPLALYQVQF